jgi:hypothetical protein
MTISAHIKLKLSVIVDKLKFKVGLLAALILYRERNSQGSLLHRAQGFKKKSKIGPK